MNALAPDEATQATGDEIVHCWLSQPGCADRAAWYVVFICGGCPDLRMPGCSPCKEAIQWIEVTIGDGTCTKCHQEYQISWRPLRGTA